MSIVWLTFSWTAQSSVIEYCATSQFFMRLSYLCHPRPTLVMVVYDYDY